MTKPADKEPKGAITDKETRMWRAATMVAAMRTAEATELCAVRLWELLRHFTSANHFAVTIESEPLTTPMTGAVVTNPKGSPIMPIAGTIAPNSRAVVTIVPLSTDGVPTALEGDLAVNFAQPSVYVIDNTNPLSFILKVDPPADLDAQPITNVQITDSADNDPSLDIEFNWEKAIITIKATQFSATIASEPIA